MLDAHRWVLVAGNMGGEQGAGGRAEHRGEDGWCKTRAFTQHPAGMAAVVKEAGTGIGGNWGNWSGEIKRLAQHWCLQQLPKRLSPSFGKHGASTQELVGIGCPGSARAAFLITLLLLLFPQPHPVRIGQGQPVAPRLPVLPKLLGPRLLPAS